LSAKLVGKHSKLITIARIRNTVLENVSARVRNRRVKLMLKKMRKLWIWFVVFVLRTNTKPRMKTRRKSKSNYLRGGTYKTLSGLLENIDIVQERLLCKTIYSETHRKTRKALRNLGPYIPHVGSKTHTSKVMDTTKLSAIIFVALSRKNSEREKVKFKGSEELVDACPSEFIYAVKAPKRLGFDLIKPRHKSLAVYECGIAFRDPLDDKLAWTSFYSSVNKAGEVEILRQRMPRKVSFPKKPGRCGQESGTYTQMNHWGHSTIDGEPIQECWESVESFLRCIFCSAINFWMYKDQQWSVSIQKRGYRVTFSVPMKETKYYFKDREKTALTPTGKIKTIIHYVREHQRHVNNKITTVKEHLRGMRKFHWHSCFCCVTAPKFHLFTSQDFVAAPSDFDDSRETYVEIDDVAKMLANLEDHQDPTSEHLDNVA